MARRPEPHSHEDHGFLRGRRVAGALMVQQNVLWRARRRGFSCVLDNEDMSNAFGSTAWGSLSASLERIVKEEDLHFAEQRFRRAVIRLPAADG
eukprot:3726419-Lingulodinium_polyedra.AAC.1